MRPALALLVAAAFTSPGCADPSELKALHAKKASLESERAVQQQLLADEDLYRSALKKAPQAGMPLDPAEVTARVTRTTSGVAVSVDRSANGGLGVSLVGPASPGRAAVALSQLALHLPDLSLASASLGADGFTARGHVEKPGPALAKAAPAGGRTIVPLTEVRKLREEVAALEREVQAARSKVEADLAERGPAAVRAVQSPDRFRQQAAVVQALVGGPSPVAATAEFAFEPALVTARGTLAPGRKVMDALPLFKADYDVQSMSENAGRFELKLSPRATASR